MAFRGQPIVECGQTEKLKNDTYLAVHLHPKALAGRLQVDCQSAKTRSERNHQAIGDGFDGVHVFG